MTYLILNILFSKFILFIQIKQFYICSQFFIPLYYILSKLIQANIIFLVSDRYHGRRIPLQTPRFSLPIKNPQPHGRCQYPRAHLLYQEMQRTSKPQ